MDNEIFQLFLNILVELLIGGNREVQNSIYAFFIQSNESEVFFKKIHDVIEEEIVLTKRIFSLEENFQ
jgi:hypothetical protein